MLTYLVLVIREQLQQNLSDFLGMTRIWMNLHSNLHIAHVSLRAFVYGAFIESPLTVYSHITDTLSEIHNSTYMYIGIEVFLLGYVSHLNELSDHSSIVSLECVN